MGRNFLKLAVSSRSPLHQADFFSPFAEALDQGDSSASPVLVPTLRCLAMQECLFRLFLRLEDAIPSLDTFSEVFRMIDPKALDTAFGKVLALFKDAWLDRHRRQALLCKVLRDNQDEIRQSG